MPTKPEPEDWSAKRVFTTGEAAQVCGVSQQTIIRSFDKGRLHGFRVPGSKFRRIPREELVRFMQRNSIPLEAIEAGPERVLVIDASREAVRAVEALGGGGGENVRVAANAFDAGYELSDFRPRLVIVDLRTPGLEWSALCRRARAGDRRPIIALLSTADAGDAAEQADEVLPSPLTAGSLRDARDRLLAARADGEAESTNDRP